MSFAHRTWFVTTFLLGIAFCYAFPPFQTNDEDGHWLHMWGVAYGHARCNGEKPVLAGAMFGVLHLQEVRYEPGRWRWQYLRDALGVVGSNAMSTVEGTACAYQPVPYAAPGLVARFVAFGLSGTPTRGSMMRALYAARITNWILVSLAVLAVCVLVPWYRNFALFFYSLPEVLQQGMAINTDSFLLVCAGLLLVLLFGTRTRPATFVAMAAVVGLMAMTKVVYWPLCGLGVVLMHRQVTRHGWRARDVAGAVAVVVLPYLMHALYTRWLLGPPGADAAAVADPASTLAQQQMAFLKQHPTKIFVILWNQGRDFFGDDLMRGSWLSLLGGLGWSAFTMARSGYYLLLVAGVLAFAADAVSAAPAREGDPPARSARVAIAVAGAAVFATVAAVIVGMYVYFSGAFLNKMFGVEAEGVQGRYFLVPVWLWGAMALYLVRRRAPLPARLASYPAVLTTAALFSCTLANVLALRAILGQFYSYR